MLVAQSGTFAISAGLKGGTLIVQLKVENGLIASAAFHGDFMAMEPNTPVTEMLRGIRFIKSDVAEALSGYSLVPIFGDVTLDNILQTMFN